MSLACFFSFFVFFLRPCLSPSPQFSKSSHLAKVDPWRRRRGDAGVLICDAAGAPAGRTGRHAGAVGGGEPAPGELVGEGRRRRVRRRRHRRRRRIRLCHPFLVLLAPSEAPTGRQVSALKDPGGNARQCRFGIEERGPTRPSRKREAKRKKVASKTDFASLSKKKTAIDDDDRIKQRKVPPSFLLFLFSAHARSTMAAAAWRGALSRNLQELR